MTSHQMRAKVADGKPVFRNISRTSAPDTKPSMSLSVLVNKSSYLAFSAGDTTHCTHTNTHGLLMKLCDIFKIHLQQVSFIISKLTISWRYKAKRTQSECHLWWCRFCWQCFRSRVGGASLFMQCW